GATWTLQIGAWTHVFGLPAATELGLPAFGLPLSLLLLVGWLRAGRAGAVLPWRHGDRSGFWKRNRDAILVAALAGTIGTIVGGMAVALATWLLPRRRAPPRSRPETEAPCAPLLTT